MTKSQFGVIVCEIKRGMVRRVCDRIEILKGEGVDTVKMWENFEFCSAVEF
jgi:hypothetical protein